MVLTEAWAQGRPVVAQGRTDVLVGQVRRSGGGVWYSGFAEFEAAVELLTTATGLADALGRAGRRYVEREYRWPTVLDRYEALLHQTVGSRAGPPARRGPRRARDADPLRQPTGTFCRARVRRPSPGTRPAVTSTDLATATPLGHRRRTGRTDQRQPADRRRPGCGGLRHRHGQPERYDRGPHPGGQCRRRPGPLPLAQSGPFQPLPDPGYAITAVNGHTYPLFPWAVSLFAVPWVVLDDLAHKLGLTEGSMAMVRSGHDWGLQVVSMATVVAATTVVVYFISLRVLRLAPPAQRRRWAVAVALTFALATPAWSTASRAMWQHGPSMLCIAVGLLCALRAQFGQRGWMGMGAAFATAYAMRPTDSIVIIVMAVWLLVAQRRHLLAVVAGAVPPLVVLVGVNLAIYHQPLSPYYTGGQSFDVSGTMAVALAGNLISPARGLLVFCPLVALSVVGVVVRWRAGELTAFWKALAVIPVLHWLVISAFKHWWGGDSFGPRFFTDLVPVFVVLALPAVEGLARWATPARQSSIVASADSVSEPTGGDGAGSEVGAGRTPGSPTDGAPPRLGWRRAAIALTLVAVVWSIGVNAQGAILRSAWCWNSVPASVDTHPNRLWDWGDPQFARGIRTVIWGPDRRSEFTRDGVDLLGCPSEPVRP